VSRSIWLNSSPKTFNTRTGKAFSGLNGQSLVLVHEGDRRQPANAFILDLPEDWQYAPDNKGR
jgi:hypothetical protein